MLSKPQYLSNKVVQKNHNYLLGITQQMCFLISFNDIIVVIKH